MAGGDRDEDVETHPLKSKYRNFNSEATRIFFQQRQDTLFFDKFSNKETVCKREERY